MGVRLRSPESIASYGATAFAWPGESRTSSRLAEP
jgi:hypothetical protein